MTINGTAFTGSVIALNASTGAIEWQDGEVAPVLVAATMSSDMLAIGDIGGTLHMPKMTTGAQLGA